MERNMENKLYSIKKAAILSVFVMFFSLFSSTLFATIEELNAAVLSDNLYVAKKLLAKGDDPIKIDWFFTHFPSPAMSKLFLENKVNPLNPNEFLYIVLQAWYRNAELVEQIDALINLALSKGAVLGHKELSAAIASDNLDAVKALLTKGEDPQNIKFIVLPTFAMSKFLLDNKKKPMNPNKFIHLILNTPYKWEGDEEKRENLIRLALNKGASLNQIKYPCVVETLRNNQKLVLQNQNTIIENLKLFWKKFPDLQKNEEDAIDGAVNEQLIDNAAKIDKGHCWGLSVFWLYSKWLQFTYPEKTDGYTNDWFRATVKDIAAWDGKKELSKEQVLDFEIFFWIIDFFQQPEIYRNDLQQLRAELTMNVSMLDTDGKILQEEFDKEYSPQTLEEFRALLKEKISDDKLVFIIISFPGGFRHCNGLYKHGETYYRYEPNDNMGEYQDTSIEEIAKIIFDKYCTPENKVEIELLIYDFKQAA